MCVCVCELVLCLCAFYRCSLGRAQGVQTVAMGGRDPQWPLAQLEESHLPCEGAPSRPGSAAALASGNSSWLRPDAVVGADNH